ncbi:cold-regulated protein 28 isoform X2 [Salvia miltiorrhiza]|uniref:cold-regulated protein 28 isoform X2 n=1 Tax=Salvia miltiorrhiza TaxID=226208 RepID=UPI0025ACF595|nr:cold-regulated protein 28 isoform X2 [Salvia miltiorrhiza]
MEGILGSETQRRPLAVAAADTVCDYHLIRSNSDASSLTVENCKDPFRHSKNVTPDECTAWTNGKHNSYLYHLEMSFVEQLYQSKSVLARCSGHNLRDINISRKQLINLNNASNQYDVSRNRCWQKSKCAVGEPIHSSTSADPHASLENRRTHHSKRVGVHCHPSLTKVSTSMKLIRTWKQGEGMISYGTQTCSQDIIDLCRGFSTEGTGQNFMDEDNQSTLNSESQAKRLKIALEDGSHQDQIVSSKEWHPADCVLNN